MNQRLNLFLVIVCLAILQVTAMAADTNALATLQQSLQMQERSLIEGYGKSLDSVATEFKKKGDLDSYLEVDKERKRFQNEKSVPILSADNLIFRTAVVNYCKAKAGILKEYIATLEALIKTEVKADRVDSAQMVKVEQDKISFELADLQSYLPSPATKERTTPRSDKLIPGIPREAKAFGGHYYLVVTNQVSWHQAKEACEKIGGHLVIITDGKEEAFVNGLSAGRRLWIGCTNEGKQGDWKWVDGKKLTYADWCPGQPDNWKQEEHWGQFFEWRGKYAWNDSNPNANSAVGYICEWDR